MLIKTKRDETTRSGCGKTLRFLARMTKSSTQASPYKRMESDTKEKKKSKKVDEKKPEEFSKGKTLVNKPVKEKKSKKGWKRVRQAALTTCRYIGMGAAHLSPATVYSYPDYYPDPKYWNQSFNTCTKYKVPPKSPHWTSNMIYSGW